MTWISFERKINKSYNKKLKTPWSKWIQFSFIEEELEAIKMEKEDAYHKIHILERQIFEYKTAKMYMYSDAAWNTDISVGVCSNKILTYLEPKLFGKSIWWKTMRMRWKFLQ